MQIFSSVGRSTTFLTSLVYWFGYRIRQIENPFCNLIQKCVLLDILLLRLYFTSPENLVSKSESIPQRMWCWSIWNKILIVFQYMSGKVLESAEKHFKEFKENNKLYIHLNGVFSHLTSHVYGAYWLTPCILEVFSPRPIPQKCHWTEKRCSPLRGLRTTEARCAP